MKARYFPVVVPLALCVSVGSIFAADWTYYAKGEAGNPTTASASVKDADTGWAFAVTSCSRTVGETTYSGLAITGVAAAPEDKSQPVDFRTKSIFDKNGDEKRLLAFGNGSASCMGSVQELHLPDTVLEFRQKAFYLNVNIRKIEPFLPASVVLVGQNAFYGCTSLAGDLTCNGNLNTTGFASCSGITSITLGKDVSSIGVSAFEGCASVTNLVLLRESAVSLGKACFAGQSVLRGITFAAKQSLNGDANHKHFTAMTDYTVKVRVLETTLGSYSYTRWNDLDQSVRDLYAAAYPGSAETPVGLYKVPIYRGGTSTTPQWLFTYKQDIGEKYKLSIAGRKADEVPSPAYGTADYESAGFPAACTNALYTEGRDGSNKPSGEIWECWAGVWERQVEGAEAGTFTWVNIGTNAGNVITYKPPESGIYRLTWLWRKVGFVAPMVQLPIIPICTVTCGSEPSMGTWCRDGEVMSYTVADQGLGRFVRWYGDVPATQAGQRTVEVAVTHGNMSVRPYIDYPYWTVVGTQITDGTWVFGVSGSNGEYTIGKHTAGNPMRVLDFTKPVEDGGRIVGLASRAMEYGYGWDSPLSMRLPKSFARMESGTFHGDASITNIVFASFPDIDNSAFNSLPKGKSLWEVPMSGEWAAFSENGACLVPWDECGPTTQMLWKASGRTPVGLTTGNNGQWLRFLPGAGFKLLMR